MATLFLEEDPAGRGTSHAVPIEVAIDRLTPFEKKYFDAPPAIDAAHVILRVDESEINAVFPEEGYYHVRGLTPQECRGLFGLRG